MPEDVKVIVPIDRYEQLIEEETKLNLIAELIFKEAELNWRKDDLEISGQVLKPTFRAMFPAWYKSTLESRLDAYKTTTTAE